MVPWLFQPAETRAVGPTTQCKHSVSLLPGAGHGTAAFAEPEVGGPADRPQCCVLISKEVMKQEPVSRPTRQKYRVMKYLHKLECEAIRQPQ